MKSYFLRMLQYNLWANQRLLIAIKEGGVSNERILELMSHVASAQLVWLHRVEGLPTSPFPVWEVYKLHEIESMIEESNSRWVKFINGYKVDTMEEVIHYQNTKGLKFENTLFDIVVQVINHSTHHRAQVSMLIRGEGIAPPPMDYIFYRRQE